MMQDCIVEAIMIGVGFKKAKITIKSSFFAVI